MAKVADLVLDARAELGEGAIWDAHAGVLWWVDILLGIVHRYDAERRADRGWSIDQMVGTVVPRTAGGLMLAMHRGLARFTPGRGSPALLCAPEADVPTNRFNDGKCDPAGRFWAGTMDIDGTPGRGSLWRLDADGSVHRMLTGVSVSNGIAWSLDERTMYYIDTPTGQLAAFDYDRATGAITNRRAAFSFPKELGHPDGMTIDARGALWVAMWGSGCVTRWDPRTGRMLDRLGVPATQVTSCAFGGPSLDVLYITTARTTLDAAARSAQPHAGSLFASRPGVHGMPAFAFAG